MQAKWIELDQGTTIDGGLKLTTQLPKGYIKLGNKEISKKMLSFEVRGG